jgi:hypothetical protein
MIASIIVDYWLARGIEETPNAIARKRFLVVSLVVNFGLLGVFKYFNFFVDSFQSIAVAKDCNTDTTTARIPFTAPSDLSSGHLQRWSRRHRQTGKIATHCSAAIESAADRATDST